MIDTCTLDPRQLYLHHQLEGVIAGELELDQWGYWKNDGPQGSDSDERKVTLFEVFRKPNQGPANAVASVALEFASRHDLSGIPHAPVFLGSVEVTQEYIKTRFSKE